MIAYFSNVSGFTRRFVEKLELPASRIPISSVEAGSFSISEPSVLLLPTYGANGRDFVPKQVIKFLNVEANRNLITGVIGSGNVNFLDDYCKAADIVSAKLGVPVLYRFELSGTPDDIDNVQKELEKHWATKSHQSPTLS